ncbi:hypothetical protein J2129_000846 [Methanofollis sp. W23]|uniref:hypothetical protein n=1 Tax=Methanofollis sp. W23 TaxID=2817849 RepID=UPI001AE6CE80|nr:hypothetical protein [Methanofollis sp. W23]MBP2145392.1 hypothetical protein [Methanofollis sp. W23]
MYRQRWWRILKHAFDQIILEKKVPCFERVNGTFEDTMKWGVLPEGLGRDLGEEWDLYCRVTKMLRRWPACTPAEFVEHLALAEGKVPLEDHPAWSARVSMIVQAFLEHDRTLFLPRYPSGQTCKNDRTTMFGVEEKKICRNLWESDEIDETFPQLEEVSHCVLPQHHPPQKRDPGELNRRRSSVIVRGVYWAVQGYYTKTQTIPPFSVVGVRLGTGVGTRHFPMALYTWVAIRDLHREIECQMAAVHEGKDDTSPESHLQPENEG